MTMQQATRAEAALDQLSERLADVFRTGDVGDVFTADVFLDGHPPFWRFQLQGIDAFRTWLHGYAAGGMSVDVVWTLPTASGFVTEHTSSEGHDREEITARKLLLCTVREGRIAELVAYCSGDWNAELRARHAAEAPIIRP